MSQIYAALDNNQANHQASIVELEGMITNHLVSILIDLGYNLTYVAPHTIDKCKMQPIIHVKSWLVQLATRTKRKVAKVIPVCQFIMSGFPTQVTLTILPLVSYDFLIGMDWLASYKTKLDYYHKNLECVNEEGRKMTLQGIQKPVSMRQIASFQTKNYCIKGCSLYAI
jgi:hypothetical protein